MGFEELPDRGDHLGHQPERPLEPHETHIGSGVIEINPFHALQVTVESV